jgi:hypothetical protein
MIQNIFYLLLLIVGFPIGLILAKLCREEIKAWRKRLFIISVLAFILIIVMIFVNFLYKLPIIITLFFIIIICLTIIWKSNYK